MGFQEFERDIVEQDMSLRDFDLSGRNWTAPLPVLRIVLAPVLLPCVSICSNNMRHTISTLTMCEYLQVAILPVMGSPDIKGNFCTVRPADSEEASQLFYPITQNTWNVCSVRNTYHISLRRPKDIKLVHNSRKG